MGNIFIKKYTNGDTLTDDEKRAVKDYCHSIKHGKFIYDNEMCCCVPRDLYLERKGGGAQVHYVASDIKGYVSPLDGSFVEGNAAHREHQKKHGVIECGDASFDDFKPKPKGIQHGMRRVGYDLADAFAKQGL